MDDQEARQLRRRLDELERSKGHSEPEAATHRMAVQVFSEGAIPTTVPKYFACHPIRVGGAESEGATPAYSAGASTLYVLVLGPKVPVVGDRLIATSLGGRWVAEFGKAGAAPIVGNGRIRIRSQDACTRAGRSGATVTLKNNLGVVVGSGLTDANGFAVFGAGFGTSYTLPLADSPYSAEITGSTTTAGVAGSSMTSDPATIAGINLTTPNTQVDAAVVHATSDVARFKFIVKDPSCSELLPGATLTLENYNSSTLPFYASGTSDSAGVWYSPWIPRRPGYRADANGMGGVYRLSIIHPSFTGLVDGLLQLGCSHGNGLEEIRNTQPGFKFYDRWYSGRTSTGDACWNREFPATLTGTMGNLASPFAPGNTTKTLHLDHVANGDTGWYYSECWDAGNGFYYQFGATVKGVCGPPTNYGSMCILRFQKAGSPGPCAVGFYVGASASTTEPCVELTGGSCLDALSMSGTNAQGATASITT